MAEPAGGQGGSNGSTADAGNVGSSASGGSAGTGQADQGGQGGSAAQPGGGGNAGNAGSAGSGTLPGTGEPLQGCDQQLITNADFDLGQSAWSEASERRDVIVHRDDAALLAAGIAPHSGEYLAWLGGIPNGEFGQKYRTTLQQDVAIPAEASSLTLSGYVWVVQPELGSNPFDWAVLELVDNSIIDGSFEGQWQARAFGDADATTPGWVYFEATTEVLDALRGQTRTLVADSRPDGSGTLKVWLDTLRLEARCAP